MAQMRDLPPIAGAIIWARQIERQLLTYMKCVKDVLGKGWELYAEGEKLQSESSALRKKLDTRPVFDAWLHDIIRRDMGVGERLFEIVQSNEANLRFITNIRCRPFLCPIFFLLALRLSFPLSILSEGLPALLSITCCNARFVSPLGKAKSSK